MSFQKNFVVKNGLEVNGDLIFADKTANKVGIGTTIISKKLEVIGGTGLDDLTVSGVSTVNNVRIDGYLNAGNTIGNSGDYLISTGAGVTWGSYGGFRSKYSYIANPAQNSFSAAYTVGYVDVFINGVRLNESEYIATDGYNVILITQCFGGEYVDILAYAAVITGICSQYGNGSLLILNDDNNLGFAKTLNFTGSGISTISVSSGIATVKIDNYWIESNNGISTTSNVGIGTTNPTSKLSVGGPSDFNGNVSVTGNINVSDYLGFFGSNIRVGNNVYTGGTGSYNYFFGNNETGWNNTTGSFNIFMGADTGENNTTGSYNLFLGHYVGDESDYGDNWFKVLIGQGYNDGPYFDAPDKTKSKQLAIGLNTTGTTEYWLVGNEDMNIGIGVTNPTTKLEVGGTAKATKFVGIGSDLTDLNASQLTSGTVPAARITASGGDFTVGSNLYVNGNVSVGGTSSILNSQQLQIKDKDIVVGIVTDIDNNDVSNDYTANHGGIAVASTVGSPILNIPLQVGVNSNPTTYKQIMWIKEGNYSGMGTDAWVFNYAVSIGNTSSVQYGSRLTVGSGFTVYDNYVNASNISVSGISTFGNVQISSGIVTATTGIVTYYGDGSKLINLPGGGLSAIGIQSGGVNVGSAGTINFVGSGFSSITVSSGIATVNIPGTVRTYANYTASNNQTIFAALYNAGNVDVFLNGARLSNNSYTATNGTSVILNEGASTGDEIEIIGYYSYDVFNSYANYAQNLIGTPNINAGVVTATTYYGNGTNLAGIHNVGVVTYTSQVAITTYNALTSRVFEHNNVFTLASWTANFQNLNLNNNQATTVRIIGSTGNAESSLTAVQIDGTSSGVITYNLPMKFTKNKNGILQLLIVKGATGANYEVYGESTNLF